jgi:NAD dependent epimerase/dehydratase family enzyme
VTSGEFAQALGRALHRPAVLPIPSFGPKLVVGSEAATAMVFGSQRVLPRRLLGDGYAFAYPTLPEALAHVLGGSPAGAP